MFISLPFNRNPLANSFRDVHAKLASGRRGVQKQGLDGWYASYNQEEIRARKDELMGIIARLEGE